jgi:hypothetical protein
MSSNITSRFWKRAAIPFLCLAAFILLGTGCATSTIEKRRNERSAAYQSLAPETRSLVDQGQIAIGMPMEAVFIAWGKPSQVFTGQNERGGTTTTWVYTGTAWQEYRFWNYRMRGAYGRYGYTPEPFLDYDYVPRSYQSAEVVFENNVVKSWKNLTAPPPY